MTRRIAIPPAGAARTAALDAWAETLRAGGICAFPTDTVWGLGACAADERAIQRIYDVKGRADTKPMQLLVRDLAAARSIAGDWGPEVDALTRAHWPGALTIVVRAPGRYPGAQRGVGTIGLRVPDRPAVLELLDRLDGPLAATSANISGEPELPDAGAIMARMGDSLDAVIEDGTSVGGLASTVLEWDGSGWRVLRQGAVRLDETRLDETNE